MPFFLNGKKSFVSSLSFPKRSSILSRALSLGLDGLFFYACVWGTPRTFCERDIFFLQKKNNRDPPSFFFFFFLSVSRLGFYRVYRVAYSDTLNYTMEKNLDTSFTKDFLSKIFETFFL